MYQNMDDARTYGVDVNLSCQFTNELSLTAAYSYLDTQAHLYDVGTEQMKTVVIDGTAHHKWNAALMYNHPFSKAYKLGLNLSARGSSKRYYENNGNGRAFQLWRLNTTHDLKVSSFKMASSRLEAGIDNIFNYIDRTMRPYHLGNNTPGTTLYGKVVIKFNYGNHVKQYHLSTKQKNNYEED